MGYLRYIVLIIVVGFAVYQDLTTKKIKNKLNCIGGGLGIFLSFVDSNFKLIDSVVGGIIAFLIAFICWRLNAFKAGDAKLLCVVGIFLGWKQFLNCFLEMILLGAVFAIIILIYKKLKKKSNVFFPFSIPIALGCITGMFGYIWNFIK